MSMLIPLDLAIMVFVLILGIYVVSNFIFVPQYDVLYLGGLLAKDYIANCDETRMRFKLGKKKNPFAYMYTGKDEEVKLDPVHYDKQCLSRWGSRIIKWWYPGRMLAKTPLRELGQQECLRIAKTRIEMPGKPHKDRKGVFDAALEAVRVQKRLDAMRQGKESKQLRRRSTENIPLEDIIEHNVYLSTLAVNNENLALQMMKACGDGNYKELERLARVHIVLPVGFDEKKDSRDECVRDLVDEVVMVCQYCMELVLRPQYIAFPEMMKVSPDMATSFEVYGKMRQENKNENQKQDIGQYIKWVAVGVVGVSLFWMIIVILLINKTGGI